MCFAFLCPNHLTFKWTDYLKSVISKANVQVGNKYEKTFNFTNHQEIKIKTTERYKPTLLIIIIIKQAKIAIAGKDTKIHY